MICSCLIPSRGRPQKLLNTITSIRETSRREFVEILVRFDDDDQMSFPIIPRLKADGVTVIVGRRMKGYESHGTFYTELASHAKGRWVACFNDDTLILGSGWAGQLAELPLTGLIVQPEFSRLNESMYEKAEGQCVPFVPNRCWQDFGYNEIGIPTDTWLDRMLRQDHNWKTHFLTGITIWHQWDEAEAAGRRK